MTYSKAQIKDSVNRVVKFIQTNKKVPNTVRVNKDILKWANWKKLAEIKDAETRLKNYIKNKNEYPNYVNTCDIQVKPTIYKKIWTDLPKPQKDDGIKHNAVYDEFVKYFGKVYTIDDAFKKIDGKGYGHYYNNKMTNKQVIKNLATKGAEKPNCTDASQMCWHLGIAMGYSVRAIHVKCKSGEGHVRLQFKHTKHTGGKWINRDPACVISPNGKAISTIWCADGTQLAINPQWFMNDLNK